MPQASRALPFLITFVWKAKTQNVLWEARSSTVLDIVMAKSPLSTSMWLFYIHLIRKWFAKKWFAKTQRKMICPLPTHKGKHFVNPWSYWRDWPNPSCDSQQTPNSLDVWGTAAAILRQLDLSTVSSSKYGVQRRPFFGRGMVVGVKRWATARQETEHP